MTIRQTRPIPIPNAPAAALVAPGAPADDLLRVPFIRQQQLNWCWAACCEMLLQFHSLTPASQCQMASHVFGRTCCAAPLHPDCDQGAWPDDVYGDFGVWVRRWDQVFSEGEVEAFIAAKTPLEVYYAWTGGKAHVAIIVGRFANGDLLVHDPSYGTGRRSYRAVVSAYGLGAWTMTYETGVV